MKLRVLGFGMMLGGVLFFTRMIPIMNVIPEDMDFPPSGAADLARLSELAGSAWPLSHIMGLLAVCLFTLGYWAHACLNNRKQSRISLYAAIFASLAFGAFAVALIIDGFMVPHAVDALITATQDNHDTALINVAQTHALALKFFTPAIFFMFVAMGILASRIIHREFHYRWIGFLGLFIGVTGPTAYFFGITGPNWDNMQVGGSLMMAGFLWHFIVGVVAAFGPDKFLITFKQ